MKLLCWGSRDGVVVRALASHQYGLGSFPGPGVTCGLSLLAIFSAPRGFSPGTPVFLSPQKLTFPNSNLILEITEISERVLVTPWCSQAVLDTVRKAYWDKI